MNMHAVKLKAKSAGAVSVEFAIVSIFFMVFVFAIFEFGRVMFLYNNLVEATRLGARLATVCSPADVDIVKTKMIQMASNIGLGTGDISISYPDNACSALACDPVTVSIRDYSTPLAIPFVSLQFKLPAATTSVPSESLDSTNNVGCAA